MFLVAVLFLEEASASLQERCCFPVFIHGNPLIALFLGSSCHFPRLFVKENAVPISEPAGAFTVGVGNDQSVPPTGPLRSTVGSLDSLCFARGFVKFDVVPISKSVGAFGSFPKEKVAFSKVLRARWFGAHEAATETTPHEDSVQSFTQVSFCSVGGKEIHA